MCAIYCIFELKSPILHAHLALAFGFWLHIALGFCWLLSPLVGFLALVSLGFWFHLALAFVGFGFWLTCFFSLYALLLNVCVVL